MINIPKTVDDPYYRYTRQSAIAIRGNANTTVFTNAPRIAAQIHRPVGVMSRYISRKLACSCRVDSRDLIVLKGDFPASQIDDIVEQYILKYVLCRECGLPETESDGDRMVCSACGYAS